jgi:hypothetical protein
LASYLIRTAEVTSQANLVCGVASAAMTLQSCLAQKTERPSCTIWCRHKLYSDFKGILDQYALWQHNRKSALL